MAIIRMKYTLLDEIARYATGHLPEEACGLIAGSEDENGRLIEKVYYLTNVDHAEDHFTLLNSFHIENGQVEKEDLRIYSDEYYF